MKPETFNPQTTGCRKQVTRSTACSSCRFGFQLPFQYPNITIKNTMNSQTLGHLIVVQLWGKWCGHTSWHSLKARNWVLN